MGYLPHAARAVTDFASIMAGLAGEDGIDEIFLS